MVRRGERPGVARAPHHREAVADVGAPRGQGVKPEALLVCPRRLGLGTGGLDQGGAGPNHQYRTRPLTGLGGGPGQVLPGDLHRRQPPVPGHDARPRLRPHARGGTGQPPPRQAIGTQPPGQLVQDPQHRGVRRPTPGTEDLLLRGHRLDVTQTRRARGQRARRVHQRPPPMPQRKEPGPGHHTRQLGTQPEPISQQPRQHHPGLGHRPRPTDLDRQLLRPRQRGIHHPTSTPCSLHLKGVPSSQPIRSSTTRIIAAQGHLSLSRHPPKP